MNVDFLQTSPSLRRFTPLRGYAVSKDDLNKLYRLLQDLADEAGEMEVATFTLMENQTEEQLQQQIENGKKLFRVFVQIETEKKDVWSQSSEKIFSSTDFPENISRVEFDTGFTWLNKIKAEPKHRVFLLLDFRKYGATGITVQPAQATPNDSQFTVSGENSNWVHAAKSRIDNFFETRKKEKRIWIHSEGTYDIILMIVGIVFVAWTMSNAVPVIDDWFAKKGTIYVFAAYLFVFLLSLRFFLFMFN